MLILSVILSIIAYYITLNLISSPAIHSAFIKKGLSGKDLHKTYPPVIPEAMGVIVGFNYLLVTILLIPFTEFTVNYLSALLSLTCMILLGFCDDLFDLKWRWKLVLPLIATIPLLTVYSINDSNTTVFLFKEINIGWLIYVFMILITIFCTNSINIYAGINGIEVGQCVVISLSLILNDFLFQVGFVDEKSKTQELRRLHLFSLEMLVPFVFVSLALLSKNRFPASVFVGDTYCYFSGMLFACVAILAKYPKTLLLFFIPQIFNFLFSCPQLFRFIPCPRHRLPGYENGLLVPSYTETKRNFIVNFLSFFKLVHVKAKEGEENIVLVSNLTMLNVVLVWMGNMSEDNLWKILMIIQILSSAVAFSIRYGIVGVFEYFHLM